MEGKTKGNMKTIGEFVMREMPPPPPQNLTNIVETLEKQPFTNQEKEIMDLIIEAHNKFTTIEQKNPSDNIDWVFHIHGLQRILGQRVLRRDYPNVFPTHKK